MTTKTKLNPPGTFPRDNQFLAKLKGYPWLVAAIYNPLDNDLSWAMVEASGEDVYYTTEWDKLGELEGWLPWPEL